jgi:hypothetical protein
MFWRWAYLEDNERVNAMCENKTSLNESFLENIRPGELSGLGFGGGESEERCIERTCQGIRRYASGWYEGSLPILVAHHMPRSTEGLRVSCISDCFSREWQIVSDGEGLKEGFIGRGHPFEEVEQ